MAIPNPNPNIRDLEQVDNYTWSSNKIAGAIKEAGGSSYTTRTVWENPEHATVVDIDLDITLDDFDLIMIDSVVIWNSGAAGSFDERIYTKDFISNCILNSFEQNNYVTGPFWASNGSYLASLVFSLKMDLETGKQTISIHIVTSATDFRMDKIRIIKF